MKNNIHNRSNSTISKKSQSKDNKNCFKINLTDLVAKEKINNKINIEPK